MTLAADDARAVALSAAGGDRAALERLIADHVDFVHGVCRRITGPDDALDATQEALVSVVRGISGYDGRARFTTWLYRVATNAALMELRRRGRRPEPVEPLDELPSDRSGPAERAVARLDVDAALASLPEEQRVVIVLREYEDLEYAEIADILHVPVGTVRSRLNRARRALLDILGNPVGSAEHPTGEDA